MRFRTFTLLPLLLLAACGKDDTAAPPGPPPRYAETEPAVLSTGSPTRDEDPSVVLAQDGSIVAAWYSDRGGNSDIYVARCTGGTNWSAPVRVTVSADGDFYPDLFQDSGGVFHLTWYRWYAPDRGHIWYNQTTDPLVWNPNDEIQVTTVDDVDDWVPSISQTPDSLRIFFVSSLRNPANTTNNIYYASAGIDSLVWGPARPFVNNSPYAHDHLPFAVWTGSRLDIVWVRHDTSQPAPWLDPPPTTEICRSYTPDGLSWATEIPVTIDFGPVVHIFPEIYQRSDGEWRMLWSTTKYGPAQIVEFPLFGVTSYPSGLISNTNLPAGYSHRVIRTPVADLYFSAWVEGPDGAQDIVYRFYKD